jgi:hypothetical protein
MLRSWAVGHRLLRQFERITAARGRIIAETFDPHSQDDVAHRTYGERNQVRGRMPGQLRVRVRYRELATAWFDWLQVSRDELRIFLDGTTWRLTRILGEGPGYVAVIDKV